MRNFARMPLTLVTGPVRSGKSTFAQRLAHGTGKMVEYIATAGQQDGDIEWSLRLALHAKERPAHWATVETAQMSLEQQLAHFSGARNSQCLVVDSLGTWLAAEMQAAAGHFDDDAAAASATLEARAIRYATGLESCAADTIVVGEQVGWDIVPVAASARAFRDILGRMQQRLGAAAHAAYLIVAGYSFDMRKLGEPIR